MNERLKQSDKTLKAAFLVTSILMLLAATLGMLYTLSANSVAATNSESTPIGIQSIEGDTGHRARREVRRFQDMSSSSTDITLFNAETADKESKLAAGRVSQSNDAG
ncbi:MAG: hypothetical protein JJU31_07885 [Wenzhouxiangella sp.]|nr:hypothetical protein [Wenzhouxiangella sp.]MCH8478417.1 hypothetical protein [Wenzhouxiangella sp.]